MDEKNRELMHDWLDILLKGVEDGGAARQMLSRCAAAHYRAADMDRILAPMKGDLSSFLEFLQNEWGWKITHDRENRTIVADENKDECVCPMNKARIVDNPLLCECSCGFAERMFSVVMGTEVNASIKRSILRGGSSCVYEVRY